MAAMLQWKETNVQRTCLLAVILFYVVCIVAVGEAVIAPKKQQLLPIADESQFNKQHTKINSTDNIPQKQQRNVSVQQMTPSRRPDHSQQSVDADDFHFYPPVIVTRPKRSTSLKFARYDVSDWGDDDEKITEPAHMLLSFDADKDGDDDSGDDMFHAEQETARQRAALLAPEFDEDEDDDNGDDADAGGDDDDADAFGKKLKGKHKAAAAGATFAFDEDDDDETIARSAQLARLAALKNSLPSKIVAHDQVLLRRKRSVRNVRESTAVDGGTSSGFCEKFSGKAKVRRKLRRPAAAANVAFEVRTKDDIKHTAKTRQDAYSDARRARREKSLQEGAFPQVGTVVLNHGDPDEQCPSGYYFVTMAATPTASADRLCLRFTKTPVTWNRGSLACDRLSGTFSPMFTGSVAKALPFIMQHRGVPSFWLRQAYGRDGQLRGYQDVIEQNPTAYAEWSPKQADKDRKFREQFPAVLYVLHKPDPDPRKIFTIQTMKVDHRAYALCLAPAKIPNNHVFRDGHRSAYHVRSLQASTPYCPADFQLVQHVCLYISKDEYTYSQITSECAKKAPGAKALSMVTPTSMNLLSEILRRTTDRHSGWILARQQPGFNSWYWGPDLADPMDRSQLRQHHAHKAGGHRKPNAKLLASAEAEEGGDDGAAASGGDKPVEAQNKMLENAAVAAIAAPTAGTAAVSNANNDEDADKKKAAEAAEAAKAEEAEKQAEAAKQASAEQEEASKKAADAEKAADEAKEEADKKAKEADKQVDNAEKAEDKLEQKAEEMKAGPTGGGDDDEKKDKHAGGKPASDDWDPSHYEIHQIPLSAIEKSSDSTFERLFGHKIMDLSKTFDNMPPEIADDTTRDAETARSLIMIMLSKWYEQIDQHHPNEIAKKLLRKIMGKHKPRQCYATTKPVAEASDTVICLSTQGPIHLCYKEDKLDGTVARGCGIPDKKIFWGNSKCHVTTDGAFCYCENDVCNSATRRTIGLGVVVSMAVSVAVSLILILLP